MMLRQLALVQCSWSSTNGVDQSLREDVQGDVARRRVADSGETVGEVPVAHGRHNGDLVGEILVERADTDAGAFGDAVGVEMRLALALQNLSSRLEDGGASGQRAALFWLAARRCR